MRWLAELGSAFVKANLVLPLCTPEANAYPGACCHTCPPSGPCCASHACFFFVQLHPVPTPIVRQPPAPTAHVAGEAIDLTDDTVPTSTPLHSALQDQPAANAQARDPLVPVSVGCYVGMRVNGTFSCIGVPKFLRLSLHPHSNVAWVHDILPVARCRNTATHILSFYYLQAANDQARDWKAYQAYTQRQQQYQKQYQQQLLQQLQREPGVSRGHLLY